MKWILGTMVLLFAITLVAQQQDDQYSSSPNGIPTAEQKQSTRANADVRYEIQSRYDTLPDFNGSRLKANITDRSITVTGYVNSRQQHDLALSTAQAYANGRQVVDEIRVGGSPDYREPLLRY